MLKSSKKEASIGLEAARAEVVDSKIKKDQTTSDILQSIALTSNTITLYPATTATTATDVDSVDLIDDIDIMTDAEMMLQAYGRIYE